MNLILYYLFVYLIEAIILWLYCNPESEEVEQPASIITSKEIITHNNSLYGLSDFEIVRFILFPP